MRYFNILAEEEQDQAETFLTEDIDELLEEIDFFLTKNYYYFETLESVL